MKHVFVWFALFTIASAAAASVRVTCVIDSQPMKARYRLQNDPDAAAAAAEIAEAVAGVIPHYLPQWQYQTIEAGDATLQLRIESIPSGKHTLKLLLVGPSGNRPMASGTWLEPGGLDAINGYPPLNKLGSTIATAVEQSLLAVDQTLAIMMAIMKEHVPIVTGGQWLDTYGLREEPRLVLPLPFEQWKVLTNSSFRVICSWPEKEDTAELQSKALPRSAQYVDHKSRKRYEALTLRPLRRIYGDEDKPVREVAEEVWRLIPLTVYLTVFQEPVAIATVGGGQ